MSTRWTLADIQRLEKSGKVKISKEVIVKKPKILQERQEPKGIKFIKNILSERGIEFVTEHRFLEGRKYRFDIAIPDIKLAIEYEGLMSKKSRHTTQEGYSEDCNKYNLGVANGWRILRYTAVNFKLFELDIEKCVPNAIKK